MLWAVSWVQAEGARNQDERERERRGKGQVVLRGPQLTARPQFSACVLVGTPCVPVHPAEPEAQAEEEGGRVRRVTGAVAGLTWLPVRRRGGEHTGSPVPPLPPAPGHLAPSPPAVPAWLLSLCRHSAFFVVPRSFLLPSSTLTPAPP